MACRRCFPPFPARCCSPAAPFLPPQRQRRRMNRRLRDGSGAKLQGAFMPVDNSLPLWPVPSMNPAQQEWKLGLHSAFISHIIHRGGNKFPFDSRANQAERHIARISYIYGKALLIKVPAFLHEGGMGTNLFPVGGGSLGMWRTRKCRARKCTRTQGSPYDVARICLPALGEQKA